MGAHTITSVQTPPRAMELYIDFDGRQLTVATDASELRDGVAHDFRHMLVNAAPRSIGTLTVVRYEAGYAIRGDDLIDFPEIQAAGLLPLLKDEVRMRFMRDRPDLLWLHGGAAERGGAAVLVVGPSGAGKSTLTTLLCERGWRLLSDDVAPVRMESHEVLPFPQSPLRRRHPGVTVDEAAARALGRDAVDISPGQVHTGPAVIGAIVFVEYGGEKAADLKPMAPGSAAMEILRNATNFVDHGRQAVKKAAEMARALPAYTLMYVDPRAASDEVNRIW